MRDFSIDWNAANAIATFAAVLVALGFGLRDSRAARRQRAAKQDYAIAFIAPALADADGALLVAIQEIEKAASPDAEADVVMHAWKECGAALSAVQVALEVTRPIRADLPLDSSTAIALAEGVAAALAKRTKPFDAGVQARKGDDLYTAVCKMLVDVLPIVKAIRTDLALATEVGRPVIDRIRPRLNELKKRHGLGD